MNLKNDLGFVRIKLTNEGVVKNIGDRDREVIICRGFKK
jgi:hypothetical protein